jgi:hypothetical protein
MNPGSDGREMRVLPPKREVRREELESLACSTRRFSDFSRAGHRSLGGPSASGLIDFPPTGSRRGVLAASSGGRMRKLHPIVFIGPRDFRRFQGILRVGLPDSYDEWLAVHAIEKNRRRLLGFDVREIQVSPDELIQYGRNIAEAPTVVMLHRIACEKARDLTP